MFLRSSSIAFSLAISARVTMRCFSVTSNKRSLSTRSFSTASTRSLFFCATIIWRSRFSSAMRDSSSVWIRAFSAFNFSCCWITAVSASSRARIEAISRFCFSSVSANWRFNSRIASLACTFCCVIVFSFSRSIWLASIFCLAVS